MYEYILVGLGNPGTEYAHTRHNVGFDTVDCILKKAEEYGRVRELSGHKFSCELFQAELPSLPPLLLAKPLTFMNASGRCVQPLLAWYKLPPEALIVIHDDLDIPVGQLRWKFSGGNAGHNGLKSITACLGTNAFYRLRIGIGRPLHKNAVIDWVLSRAQNQEAEDIAYAEQIAIDVLAAFFQDGQQAATTKANASKALSPNRL
ncbi:MAG: aminoacyl-tRNA hydrolase [Desulfovibrio sp.]|nr:aminoacyl-tRNA hydrolase [Desulfovibrio sp.]